MGQMELVKKLIKDLEEKKSIHQERINELTYELDMLYDRLHIIEEEKSMSFRNGGEPLPPEVNEDANK